MTQPNPFIVGQLVQEPAMFFGRQEEIARLQDATRKSGSVAVVGLRRIGKSSLLYQLAQHTDLAADVLIAYIDLHHPRTRTVAGLLTVILQGLDEHLNRYQFEAVTTMAEFAAAVEQMRDDGYRPVICLDEVEKLMEQPCFDRDFFEAWRSLGQMGTVAFVTASCARLADVIQPGGKTSPFFNIFSQLNLAGLTPDAARALLTEPFRQASRPAPPPAHVDQALQLAGRHPLFLQQAGELLWRDGGVNRELFREKFAQAVREPMRLLWLGLSAEEQAAVSRLVTGQGSVPNWEAAQNDLLNTGLAQRDEAGKLHPFSLLLAEWVKSGELTRETAHRPGRYNHRPLEKKKPTAEPTVFDWAVVAVGIPIVVLMAVMLIPQGREWLFIVLLLIILPFVLAGLGRITGSQYLDWLTPLRDWIGKWWQG